MSTHEVLTSGRITLQPDVVASTANITLDPETTLHHLTGSTTVELIAKTGFFDGQKAVIMFRDAIGGFKQGATASDSYRPIILHNVTGGASVASGGITVIYNSTADIFVQV